MVESLIHALGTVTIEDFRRQETRYDLDSRLGRELLYLIANDEWIHTTTEVVDLQKSTTIDATIRVEVNLDRITHEAFREPRDQLWLPLLVLPPRAAGDDPDRHLTAAVPLVTDAGGEVLSTLPQLQVRRWVSAALSEIMLNSGAGLGRANLSAPVTCEQRMLLGVAVWRALRGQSCSPGAPGARTHGHETPGDLGARGPAASTVRVEPGRNGAPDPDTRGAHPFPAMTTRLDAARTDVEELLKSFREALEEPAPDRRADHDTPQGGGTGRSRLLVRRIAGAIDALSDDSMVVVVATPQQPGPTTFSVRLPDRPLLRTHSSLWASRGRGVWASRSARVTLDVLVPSAHADRQLLIRLPDGVEHVRDGADTAATAEIRSTVPGALNRFLVLWRQVPDEVRGAMSAGSEDPGLVVEPGPNLDAVDRCLITVALSQADIAQDVFRYHGGASVTHLEDAFRLARERLRWFAEDAGGEPVPRPDAGAMATLQSLAEEDVPLRRTPEVEPVNPGSVLVRLDAIDDSVLRGGVESARVCLTVAAEDWETLRTARFTGRMSLLILLSMLVGVVAFDSADSQVLATLLTLFAAVQASRIEHPDRSTLRGLLTSTGSWVVPLTITPSVLLGVTLAFRPQEHDQAGLRLATLTALTAQLALQIALESWRVRRRPGRGGVPRLELTTFPRPDHGRISVLHGTWWRGTAGAALLLGRTAHAYVVLQTDGGTLPDLLGTDDKSQPSQVQPPIRTPAAVVRHLARRIVPEVPGVLSGPANILAMLRSGTGRESLTFLVFRQEPPQNWIAAKEARGFELSPDRLIPAGSPAGLVDVFLGLSDPRPPDIARHPLLTVLSAAAKARWQVSEIQLPIPAPAGGDPARRWLRVRMGLRDDDEQQLRGFLTDLTDHARDGSVGDVELLVRGAPHVRPERLHPAGSASPLTHTVREDDRRAIHAADLDVLSLPGAAPTGPQWEIISICSYSRAGNEKALLEWVADRRPGLRLAGLTISRLYGTTVIFLLGHQQGGPGPDDQPLLGEIPDHEDDLAEVLHDEWRDGETLGTPPGPGHNRILQVHVQSRDVPGTLSEVLEALNGSLGRLVLRHRTPPPVSRLEVWYLRLEVAEGQVARCRFTLRLPSDLSPTDGWQSADWERARRLMEREVRQALTDRLRTDVALNGDPADVVDTVLSTRLVQVEPREASPPGQVGAGAATHGPTSSI